MTLFNSEANVTISSAPFNFMVVENVFDPIIASSLEYVFRELIVNATEIAKVGEVGELNYAALNFTP